ncbi:MAG: hypothetical protein AABY18_04190 [Candidatus Thermoplasmatota archaeon]
MRSREAPALVPLVERVHARLRPSRALPRPPHVVFYPYANGASTVRERDGRLHFRITTRLEGAPDEAVEGVVAILLSRVLRVDMPASETGNLRTYREHLEAGRGREEPKRRKHIDPVGEHRSLLESYLRVSLDLGLVLPQVPTLSWSKTVARHRFGHWDPEHNAVVISQVLDDPKVPEFVLDYVLYHELLHILHPVKMGSGSKRIVHSAAFKRDERKFPGWKEADAWINRLARRR